MHNIMARMFRTGTIDQEAGSHLSLPPDDDIHRFNELLDIIDRSVNTDDYRVPLLRQRPVDPTRSVVEVHQPYLPPPEPEQPNTQVVTSDIEKAQVNICQYEKLRRESKV